MYGFIAYGQSEQGGIGGFDIAINASESISITENAPVSFDVFTLNVFPSVDGNPLRDVSPSYESPLSTIRAGAGTGSGWYADQIEVSIGYGGGNAVDGNSTSIAEYSTTNTTAIPPVYFGQSFKPTASGKLGVARFYTGKLGSPVGNVYVKLYSHTGTYGTTGTPSVLLATSEPQSSSDLPDQINYYFTTPYDVVSGTAYFLVFDQSAVTGGSIKFYIDSAAGYAGSTATSPDGSSWTADATIDAVFRIGVLDKFASIERGLIFFDTSSLGVNAVISSANLKLRGTYKSNQALTVSPPDLCIAQGGSASDSSIVASDYAQAYHGATVFGSVSYNDFSASAYNDILLNTSGKGAISKTGITKFSVQTSFDLNNLTPGTLVSDYFRFYSSGATGTGFDPVLIIKYYIFGVEPNETVSVSENVSVSINSGVLSAPSMNDQMTISENLLWRLDNNVSDPVKNGIVLS